MTKHKQSRTPNQKRVLIATLKMSDEAVNILSLNGVTKEYARHTLKSVYRMTDAQIKKIEE